MQVFFRQPEIPEMSERQDERAGNGHRPVRKQPIQIVYDQCANDQNNQSGCPPINDARLSMPAEADGQRNDADRNHENQQFLVHMVVLELAEKGQERHDKRQQEAMQETQPGQPDGDFVE